MAQIFTTSEAVSLISLINNRIEGMDLSIKEVKGLEELKKKVKANLIPERQEFLYNFKSGGCNSEYASTKDEAYMLAVKRWKDSATLIVDEKSVRSSSDQEHDALMNNFY